MGRRRRLAVGGGRGIAAATATTEHVFANQLQQIHRRLGEADFVARLEGVRVAARLQPDITLAQQAAGEDAGRGVGGQVLVFGIQRQGDDRIELGRVQADVGHLADGHPADLYRCLRAQLADLAEAGGQRVLAGAKAPALVGRGHRQHQQRGQGQQQKGADGEFESWSTHGHSYSTHLNNIAERTKLNISTSKEAFTTARVVATEVPSMVGSAWKPT